MGVEKGANVDQVANDGYTPLLISSQKGFLEVVQHLVEKGANVNQVANDGYTPLLISSQEGFLEVVKYLVEKGANVNQVDNNGKTPLVLSLPKHIGVAKFLLRNNANIKTAKLLLNETDKTILDNIYNEMKRWDAWDKLQNK